MRELFDHAIEREVLASLMQESALDVQAARAALDVSQLARTDFHLPFHSEAFGVISDLLRSGSAANPAGMAARSKRLRAEDLVALDLGCIGILSALPGHAETLRALAMRRQAIVAAEAVRAKALDFDAPIEEVLGAGASAWASLTHATTSLKSGTDIYLRFLDRLDAVQRGEIVRCIPTGIDLWDQILGGVDVGLLTFIGSQPGVGKSSLIATMHDNWMKAGVRSLLFSLEDPEDWVHERLTARDAAVPLFVLAKKPLVKVQRDRVQEKAPGFFERLPNFWVDDRRLLTVDAIVQTARHAVMNLGVQVVVIDHLGKIDHQAAKHDRHDLAYAWTLNKLSALAHEMRVPVVIAAHLKDRDADAKFRRPEVTDFAQSAFIERDARAAVGLYLVKDDPDTLMVGVLKQTRGQVDQDFALRRLKEAGLVLSRNGVVEGLGYDDDEQKLLNAREREIYP